jgi:hypothetical protein
MHRSASVQPRTSPLVVAARDAERHAPPRAVYLGTGVTAQGSLATGALPLDALGMVLAADHVRAVTGAASVVHLVADEHAVLAGRDRGAVRMVADTLESNLRRAVAALGIEHYRVVRASEIQDRRHRELVAHTATSAELGCGAYALRQAADVEWVREVFGATVKVGWTAEHRLDVAPRGFDERFFDGVYARIFGDRVSTVYLAPGRRVDAERPRTSPYIHMAGELRATTDTPPAAVPQILASSGMRRHLRPLVHEVRSALDLPANHDLPSALAEVLTALQR